MEEVWRPIAEYEGYYLVSKKGKIKTIHGRKKGLVIKQYKKRNGYMYVSLYKNGVFRTFLVHRLVAFAFPDICGEWFEGAVINHKDENKENNNASNLEFCTQGYNINYGTRNEKVSKKMTGRYVSQETINKVLANRKMPPKGEGYYHEKKVIQKDTNGIFIQEFPSISEAARFLGISGGQHISQVCSGKLKTAYGYKWEYA